MGSRISAVSYYLPPAVLSNKDLSRQFPEWSVDKISAKTGIWNRHIAGDDVYSSDLATEAARALFREHSLAPSVVDYLIVCTQSPDYYLPSTSTIVHANLGLADTVGATDVALGCSGYVYSLGLAKGLIESSQAHNVLVITADTYSKFINDADKSIRTIFGDGAAATLVSGDAGVDGIRAVTYGSDGAGAKNLIVGGLRAATDIAPKASPLARDLESNGFDLYMDGPEIFGFTLRVVPPTVEKILEKANLTMDEIDLFVFHQANQFMLDHLRKKLGIDESRFYVSLRDSGNTVSSTIPIALAAAVADGTLVSGMKVMILGFGVGLSWGGLVLEW